MVWCRTNGVVAIRYGDVAFDLSAHCVDAPRPFAETEAIEQTRPDESVLDDFRSWSA